MNSSLSVIRAVAGEIANRVYLPVMITALIIAVVLIALVIWLTTMNTWWLLLAIPVFLLVIIAGVILIVVRIIMAAVIPSQTKTQRKAVKAFTDKILNVSELTQTPKFVILFRVARDVISPKKSGYIESVVSETIGLKNDFTALRHSFE